MMGMERGEIHRCAATASSVEMQGNEMFG